MGEQVRQLMNSELDKYIDSVDIKKTETPAFIERLQKTQEFMITTLDSIQSFKPFYSDLFKLYLQTFHLKLSDFASNYWNKNYKKFGGHEIMQFLNILYLQENMINKYGMNDPRYFNSYNELSGTFCVRTFNNMMPMILQVLEKMQTDFYKEKNNNCNSHGPVDLFRFVNEVFDCYDHCPQSDICKSLLSLVFKIISSFQTEFKKVALEAEDMSIEVFCAMTNSNMKFMSAVRTFMERVEKNTNMDMGEVQQVLNYQLVIKNFAMISNSSFIRIQELMTYNLNHMFSQIKDHQSFDVEKFLGQMMEGIGPVFDMLVSVYSKKLWKHIHDTFCSLFIQLVITFSVSYKQNEQKKLTDKLEKEIEIVNDFYDGKISKKEFAENTQKLDDLFQCLVAPSDKVVLNIMNLHVKLGDKFNEKCMKCLMRLRSDINDKQKQRIYVLIKEEEDRIKQMRRVNFSKSFYSTIMSQFKIHQFVIRFRERKRLRDLNKKKKEQVQKDQAIMQINDNERHAVEEAAIGMRGMMSWCKKIISAHTDPDDVVNKARTFKFEQSYFSFLNELLIWKQESNSSEQQGRVFLIQVDKIGVGMGEEFYFVIIFKYFLED